MIHFKTYLHAGLYDILNLANPDEIEEYIWAQFCNYYRAFEGYAIFFYIPTDEEITDPDWDFSDWQIEIINRLIDAGVEQGQTICLDVNY